MKKMLNFVRILLLLILIYMLISSLGFLRFFQNSEAPTELLTGKWEGEREYIDVSGSLRSEKIHLQFLQPGILTYSSSLSPQLKFGIVFLIDFVSQNQLVLTGRIRDEWKVIPKENTISIQGGVWEDQIVVFRPIFNTGPIIVFLLGILIIQLTSRSQRTSKEIRTYKSESAATSHLHRFNPLMVIILHAGVLILGAAAGTLLMDRLLVNSLLLNQGLPWWPLIIIELFGLFLIVGLKLLIASRDPFANTSFLSKGKSYLSVFLVGSSINGIFTGSIRFTFLYLLQLILIRLSS